MQSSYTPKQLALRQAFAISTAIPHRKTDTSKRSAVKAWAKAMQKVIGVMK